ncbi:unnamed protein product [Rotaria sp. Silwood1]|nr:unnamed protein product [Rotaria sp. Silwood1]CAF3701311.1 unnamed protein product [Rotaria sp. Silwood1]CAF4621545.1 unnamed protein product [Rotaria sp. Silwood1]
MVQISQDTLPILVLIAVILAGVTFIAVTIVIICLLCIKYRSSKKSTDEEHLSTKSSTTHSARSSPAPSSASSLSEVSVRSNSTKTPVVTIPRKKQRPPSVPLSDYRSDRISVIDEVSSDDETTHKQVIKHDKKHNTIVRNDSQVNTQRYIQRQQQKQEKPIKPITDVRFIDRHTPYPPDVIERERYMMANRGFRSTYDQ